MAYDKNDWILLFARLLMTVVFFQSLEHHRGDFPAWIKNLSSMGVPDPNIAGVLSEVTLLTAVTLLITGWYPKIAVALLIMFIAIATPLGHRFWELQGAARAAQFANFTKNFSLVGGVLFYLASGPGRIVLGKRS